MCILRPFSPPIPSITVHLTRHYYARCLLSRNRHVFHHRKWIQITVIRRQLSKTSVDDLPLFSFYSSLLINFYVKDKLFLFHYIPKKVKKTHKTPNYDGKSVNWWVQIVKNIIANNSLLFECLCWRHLKILLTLWKLQ